MRVACYLRVSTDGQAEKGYSLPEQESILAEYCARRGYTLVEQIRDEGVSGKLTERPGLRRIQQLAEAGAVDGLVAVKLDRLGRQNRIVQDILHQAREQGLRVEFTEHASGDTPADRLLLNVLGGVAEFEWELIRTRTMSGRMRKAQTRGVMPNGRAPFGFRCISKAEAAAIPEYHGRDGEYIIVDPQAELVREIYRRCLAGQSLSSIEKWLNDSGHRTPAGYRFSRSLVHSILTNPAYMGRPVYHRIDLKQVEEKSPSGTVKKSTRRIRSADEWVELSCPAIIDEPAYNAVQKRLAENKEMLRGRRTHAWLLSGLVVCEHCKGVRGNPRRCVGVADTRRGVTPLRHYYCASRSEGLAFCGTKYSADHLESAAVEMLERLAAEGFLANQARLMAREEASRAGDPAAQLRACEAELTKLDREEEALLEQSLQGFSKTLIQRKLGELAQRRSETQRQLLDAQTQLHRLRDPEEAARRAEMLADTLRARLEQAKQNPDVLAQLCRSFFTIRLRNPNVDHPDRKEKTNGLVEAHFDIHIPEAIY